MAVLGECQHQDASVWHNVRHLRLGSERPASENPRVKRARSRRKVVVVGRCRWCYHRREQGGMEKANGRTEVVEWLTIKDRRFLLFMISKTSVE
jgi:hypothetical protein